MEIKGIDFPDKDLFIELFGEDVYLVGGVVRDFIICYLFFNVTQNNCNIDEII